MPATFTVTERPERELDMAAVRNNLLYAVRERKYRRSFNVFASTSRVTLGEVTAATGIPQIGDAYPSDSLAVCIKVKPYSSASNRQYFRVDCEYDTSWIVNAITDNPLNQLPEVSWSGPTYERGVFRDNYGVVVKNSAGFPFDPPMVVDESRELLRIVRNEATFNEAYAKLWRKKLNQNTFAGYDPLSVRINTIEATRNLSNGILYWQVTYELEFREFPDAFVMYPYDLGYMGPDYVQFVNPKTGQPFQNAVPMNGRGVPIGVVNALTPANGAVTLGENIDDNDTEFDVPLARHRAHFPPNKKAANGDGIVIGPDWEFDIRIDDEIMRVTNVVEAGAFATYTVTRGYAGTTAAAHTANTQIFLEPYQLRFIPHYYADFDDLDLPVI